LAAYGIMEDEQLFGFGNSIHLEPKKISFFKAAKKGLMEMKVEKTENSFHSPVIPRKFCLASVIFIVNVTQISIRYTKIKKKMKEGSNPFASTRTFPDYKEIALPFASVIFA